jgi:hypothetical protein
MYVYSEYRAEVTVYSRNPPYGLGIHAIGQNGNRRLIRIERGAGAEDTSALNGCIGGEEACGPEARSEEVRCSAQDGSMTFRPRRMLH